MSYPHHTDSAVRGSGSNTFDASPYGGKQYDQEEQTRFAKYPPQAWPEKEKINRNRIAQVPSGSIYDCRSTYPEDHVLMRAATPTNSPPRGDALKVLYERADLPEKVKEIIEVPAWLLFTKDYVLQPVEDMILAIRRKWMNLGEATQPSIREPLYQFVAHPVPIMIGQTLTAALERVINYLEQCIPIALVVLLVPHIPTGQAQELGLPPEKLESDFYPVLDFITWVIACFYFPIAYVWAVAAAIVGSIWICLCSIIVFVFHASVAFFFWLFTLILMTPLFCFILCIISVILPLVLRAIIHLLPERVPIVIGNFILRIQRIFGPIVQSTAFFLNYICRDIIIPTYIYLAFTLVQLSTYLRRVYTVAWDVGRSVVDLVRELEKWWCAPQKQRNLPAVHTMCIVLKSKKFWINVIFAVAFYAALYVEVVAWVAQTTPVRRVMYGGSQGSVVHVQIVS
ncbi:hypothetical protein P154DRAFT_566431 [Amniculicola lignicola CBS 123094]|uniref:Uncharacterized protein n=1 Tax=Amniculicola lignicola CBS 123094 TaxID=1392246 RepID=A0A6A5W1X6_9PLEO|nr:hypothetical protein P154DRAFT_566431 [Amniculicola lignicola CBS 123094]